MLGWVLARGNDIVPIPGTTNPAHLDDFLKAADLKLSAADWAEFDAAFAKIDLMGHRSDPLTESQFDHSRETLPSSSPASRRGRLFH